MANIHCEPITHQALCVLPSHHVISSVPQVLFPFHYIPTSTAILPILQRRILRDGKVNLTKVSWVVSSRSQIKPEESSTVWWEHPQIWPVLFGIKFSKRRVAINHFNQVHLLLLLFKYDFFPGNSLWVIMITFSSSTCLWHSCWRC